MITRLGVKAGKERIIPELEIGVDTVYKRYNIHTYFDNDGNEGYEYDEDELSLIEYFKDSFPKDKEITEKTLGELSTLFGLYQQQVDSTLAELSVLLGGVINNV